MIRILVPLDGSLAAETAIDHALAVARVFPACVRLLQVIDASSASGERGISSVDWQLVCQRTEAYLQRVARRYESRAGAGAIEWSSREGEAAEEIIREIDKTAVDLLVLTRYGKGEATAFPSGGTAQKVISATDASVLLVESSQAPHADIVYRNIMVAVDGSQSSKWALSFGSMIARVHDGDLHLLRVIEEPRLPAGAPITEEARHAMDQMRRMIRSEVDKGMLAMTARLPDEIRVASDVVVANDVPLAIDTAARDNAVDILVLAARSRNPRAGWRYGSVCEAILNHTRSPILVLRSETAGRSPGKFHSIFSDELHADAI